MRPSYLFTSESVTEGHPDKICDQVADAILDEIYKEDPSGRVACEAMVTTGLIFIAGEITTSSYVDIPSVARETIKNIGYTDPAYGFDHQSCGVLTSIHEQSEDIAIGVNSGGAGDQGMMFGYATNETRELMPLPIILAHRLTRRLSRIRKEKLVNYLRPDGKSQVTVEYEGNRPTRVEAVVISAHHDSRTEMSRIKKDIRELVIKEVIPSEYLDDKTKIFINPTGRFEIGGPMGDTGITGRKIIVDTYGGVGSHGGGCFSGKDPTKVDRSASYMARYVAKNIVAAGIADRCELQIAYAIGVAEPVSVMVNTFGTGKIDEQSIQRLILDNFDLTPGGIMKKLKLRRPIYRKTAVYGHFGRDEEGFTWEETDMADAIKGGLKKTNERKVK